MIGQNVYKNVGSTKAQPVLTYRRFPVKHANNSNKVSFIPVLTGLLWSYHKRKYRVKYSYLFEIITSYNILCKNFIIYTIFGRNIKE